ncbi:MAG: S41 family peptidase [Cyanobacteria bacterium J06597_1]
MKPLSLFSRTVTSFAILAASITVPVTPLALAGESDDARAFVDDVVQLIDSRHLDNDTVSAEWVRQRDRLRSQTYTNEAEARADIARALEYLDDPYTYLLSPSEFEAMQESVSGNAADIGIRLVLGAEDTPTVSAPPLLGSPAFYSGIVRGDVIVAVNGRNSEGWSAAQTLRQIQGRENSTVNLTLMRNSQRIDVEVVRTDLALPSVSYAVHSYPAVSERGSVQQANRNTDNRNTERRVGYIRLARFDDRAADDMKAAIADLESQAVDGYVLDLRSNPGGLLEAGTAIAEMFLDGETIVTVHDRDRVRRIVDRQAPLTDKPLSLLVDGGSASSSEILAGALRDADRATLVGTRTFGKGVVQTLYMLPDNSCLAISTASYRTPNGENLHRSGLLPDVTVPMDVSGLGGEFISLTGSDILPSASDPQYAAALASLFDLPAQPEEIEYPETFANSAPIARSGVANGSAHTTFERPNRQPRQRRNHNR